jgi:FKBP-type peptidyl-prolyl cis-trans isomerase
MRLLRLALIAVSLVPAAALAQRERLPPEDVDYVDQTWPNAIKTGTSVRYVIEREGRGAPPRKGDVAYVVYVGMMLHGKIFDQNKDRDHPFKFRVGRKEVIEGWDYIIQQMKPGEKRLVVIPSELAYGTHGWLPRIPRDATLVFEMELLKVDREQ